MHSILELLESLCAPTYVDAATQTYETRDAQTQTEPEEADGSSLQTKSLSQQLTEARPRFEKLRRVEDQFLDRFRRSLRRFDPANPQTFIEEHESICSGLSDLVQEMTNMSGELGLALTAIKDNSLDSTDLASKRTQCNELTEEYREARIRYNDVMAKGILRLAFEVEDKTAPDFPKDRRERAKKAMEKAKSKLQKKGMRLPFDDAQQLQLVDGAMRSRSRGRNIPHFILERCCHLWEQKRPPEQLARL